MWDLLTYLVRPQSSFSFYVHVVLSQSVTYKFKSLKPYSTIIPCLLSYFFFFFLEM